LDAARTRPAVAGHDEQPLANPSKPVKSAVPRLAKCAAAIPHRSKSSTRRGPTSGFDGDF
jgi:hypothetical protein